VLFVHFFFLNQFQGLKPINDPKTLSTRVFVGLVLSEHRILAIEMTLFGICDKELRAIRVGSRVRHRHLNRYVHSLEEKIYNNCNFLDLGGRDGCSHLAQS